MPTIVGPKGLHSRSCFACKVQLPGFFSLNVGLPSPLGFDLDLAMNGLAIEDEERQDAVCLPLVQVLLDVTLQSSQTSESGQEWFVVWGHVKEVVEVVASIDSNRTVPEIVEVVGPISQDQMEPSMVLRNEETYCAWPLIQESSTRAANPR